MIVEFGCIEFRKNADGINFDHICYTLRILIRMTKVLDFESWKHNK